MRIERICHRGWPEAYRCNSGPLELIVVTSMGPRILSLRLEGAENFFYEDTTGFKVGEWVLCGGHRFTTAPESDASYTPDNQPCEVAFEGDRLCIHQRLGDGLLRGLEIAPEVDRHGFVLRHVLRNCGAKSWHGAAWAITCVPRSGRVVVPKSGGLPRFWTPPGERYADASSSQWQSAEGCLVVEPRGEKGKVGLRSEPGWLAWLGVESTLVIRGPGWIPEATYPDDGCNVEVYTCANYLELETLGPLETLRPGQELAHVETWQVLPRRTSSSDAWRVIGELAPSRCAREAGTGLTA